MTGSEGPDNVCNKCHKYFSSLSSLYRHKLIDCSTNNKKRKISEISEKSDKDIIEDLVKQNNILQEQLDVFISKQNIAKKQISKILRDAVWNTYIGRGVAYRKCLCCNNNEISIQMFDCGHVISVKNGGLSSIDNMLPICTACNRSMGTEDMGTFVNSLS